MSQNQNYLFEIEDGLEIRKSNDYALYKLYALQAYLQMARTAMKNRPWAAFNYIDLQAGPGKNRIKNKIHFGSPLIALNIDPPFTHYWFNELDATCFNALKTRIEESPHRDRVHLFQKDVNDAVDPIVEAISKMDQTAAKNPKVWSTFNIAFLDPEGLEIRWETVEKLAKLERMDLIINFSTGGINRVLHQPQIIDRFFGNSTWRETVAQSGDPISRRRYFINIYRSQLENFDYHIKIDEEVGYHDIAMRNSKNAEVYSIIFASKHPLGDDFWHKVKKMVDRLQRGSKRLL